MVIHAGIAGALTGGVVAAVDVVVGVAMGAPVTVVPGVAVVAASSFTPLIAKEENVSVLAS